MLGKIVAASAAAVGLIIVFDQVANNSANASKCISNKIQGVYKVFYNSCTKPVNSIVCEHQTALLVFNGSEVCRRDTQAPGEIFGNTTTDAASFLEKMVGSKKLTIYACDVPKKAYVERTNPSQYTCQ